MEDKFISLKKIFLDFLFPSSCVGCGISRTSLCTSCVHALPPPSKEQNAPQTFHTLFAYQNEIVKKMIWALKYKGDREIATMCGSLLYEEIMTLPFVKNEITKKENLPILLTPIPLSPSRKRERGFNQGELLIRNSIAHDKKNIFIFKNLLRKIKETLHQTDLHNRKKRIENIVGSFAIKDEKEVRGKIIFIIDDVWTTGATLKEARNALIDAGAKKVFVFTVAH